jgi:hypothetical protein
MRRDGRHGAATLYVGLSFAAGLACLAAIAFGLTVIVSG